MDVKGIKKRHSRMLVDMIIDAIDPLVKQVRRMIRHVDIAFSQVLKEFLHREIFDYMEALRAQIFG